MDYFVTGATGFIGKRLVKALLARKGSRVYFLVRPGSQGKLTDLAAFWGVRVAALGQAAGSRTRAIPIQGDLTAPRLGVSASDTALLKGRISAVYHLAAVYDLGADAASQMHANVDGTRHMVAFSAAIGAGHVHHVSSIAAAGLYRGLFREDMFEQAQGLSDPYFRSKHESEKIVRTRCKQAWTIYRPGMVVGESTTGVMDKVDGPYYFFKPIQRLRQWLPPWMPSLGVEGGRINIVPVDFVVQALVHISHGSYPTVRKCFHLVHPEGQRVGEVLALFAKAAHAPTMSLFLNGAWWGLVPGVVKQGLLSLGPVRRLYSAVMKDLGLPEGIAQFVNYPTRFDCRETTAALQGSGLSCPDLDTYAWRLWDHWERHLDPDLLIDRTLPGAVRGRVVLVTGGSSGIGLAAACRFAAAGAITVICARDPVKLQLALAQIQGHCLAQGGPPAQAFAYAGDIASEADCAALLQVLQQQHGGVDFLINNAGRSIRRSIENSHDRFHDYQRTMDLNYFGCLRLTLGLLPGMVARGRGHVVNISSIGVLTNAPRFSAYVASKAALDAWTRCAASEYADRGITFTTINMPLVRTPMIAPTQLYKHLPALPPDEAAEMIARACIDKPVRIATRLGLAGQLLHAVAPRVAQVVMNTAFRMFPDSHAAPSRGPGSGAAASAPLSAEAAALQQVLRGIHL